MGDIGQDYAKGRGVHQSVIDVIQGGGICGATIWIGVLVIFGINGENSGRYAQQFPVPNHW